MQGPQENNDRVVLVGQEDMLGRLGLERVQRMETPSSGPGVRVDQEGHPHPPPWGEHGRCSPGIMVGAWPRGAKGSACPDSCCSFVTCPGSAKRRKVVLGVMAEGPLCPCASQDRHSQQHPSQWAQTLLPQGQTHLCRRDPTVLALHGEALGREKRGISGEPGGDYCLRSLPPGTERLP